ncbi:MAG: type I-E CRISPR-associated protein Cas7/Cse4/CasC [Desulfomonile tiedjei]|uniref:Type I-E CRISPR-associated protein Cas7/Cse4/CasC n=1 Tax=Desulfomonile tiedjei TaxID=2358 RepID=A0A9D6UX83_9BACT|nr:type I-E CRISPR-associated protein Cas7/Cse4/CasC [Desulfomonile tiedjei]
MLIEIHMIQNHSPANLNRDDLGAPKTCLFGGVTRARLSSQTQKRSIRNPGNPDDIHNREPGLFAEAMKSFIGRRTKLFPWLVERELEKSGIPAAEHGRIVLKARQIALSKEKDEKKTAIAQKADPRPKTPQLIHLGPGHARYFVTKLEGLRDNAKEQYDYFLNPVVGFQEIVRGIVTESDLPEKEQEKIVKSSWTIAKCRMSRLLQASAGEESEPEPQTEDDQPGTEHARLIAERLTEFNVGDPARFRDLTKPANKEEKLQLNEDAPEKPKKMDEFMEAFKSVTHRNAVDIALFGRMTTSDAFDDVAAAMQVAHAISTHAVFNEVDYFTAVDDLGKAGGGAGHVDEAMFNSACFYKYFCLDWGQLVHNLAGPGPDKDGDEAAHSEWMSKIKPHAQKLAACTLGHFLRAAAFTSPTGKQNSFASHCEPCGILVEIKEAKIPTNYANAFADPVERIGKPDDDAADEKSIEGRSVACLADHVQAVRRAYDIDSTLLWYSPKLWRFPLKYWERSADGRKKTTAKFVTEYRYDVLGGNQGEKEGLVEAVIESLKVGLKWADVKDLGKDAPEEF